MEINSGYSHRNVTVFFLEKSDTVFYFFCILQKEGTKNKLSINLCSALSFIDGRETRPRLVHASIARGITASFVSGKSRTALSLTASLDICCANW